MTTLSYPFTLVAGQPENVNQLNSNLNAITTWANGNVDTTNLATSAKPVTLLGAYRTVCDVANSSATLITSSGVWLFSDSGAHFQKSPASMLNADPVYTYLDSTDYTVSGLTPKLRVRGTVLTNGTAPAMTFTFGLYPITSSGAATTLTITAGTVVTGSTAAVASPSANAATTAVGSDFTFPSAGAYALAVAASAAMAGNASAAIHVRLEMRHV